MRRIFLLGFFTWAGLAQALECPKSGPIPETFPVGALVVSGKKSDPAFLPAYLKEILAAGGTKPPQVIVVGEADTQAAVRKALGPEASKLTFVTSNEWTWQQDYSVITQGPKGLQIREVGGYAQERKDNEQKFDPGIVAKLAAAFDPKLGITQGPATDPGAALRSGAFGGNLTALPGGLCVTGSDHFYSDNDWQANARQVCGGNPGQWLKLPTQFTDVGHQDEVFKMIPNNSRPAPCNYSIIMASPRKGLELLRESRKRKLFDPPEGSKFSQNPFFQGYCGSIFLQRSMYKELYPDEFSPEPAPSDAFSRWLTVFPWAHAEPQILDEADAQRRCRDLSGQDVLDVYESPATLSFIMESSLRPPQTERDKKTAYVLDHEDAQTELDLFRAEMTAKLKAVQPACEPDIIDVPFLTTADRQPIFPGVANSVVIGDTILLPDPYNKEIREQMRAALEQRKMKVRFIDTGLALHAEKGNLHCATKVVNVCGPGSVK